MIRSRYRSIGWLGIGLCGLAWGPATGQAPTDEWRIESSEATFAVAGTASVALINPFGDVRVRGGEGEGVVVTMVAQRHRDDPRRVDLVPDTRSGGLVLEVGFDDRLEVAEMPGWEKRRIDVGVSVPEDLSVEIRAEDGSVELEDLAARFSIATGSGDVRLRLREGGEARSEHGSLHATLLRTRGATPLTLETVTGSLRVDLPEGAGATVGIETQGRITTDYTITIEREAGRRFKRAHAEIGDGALDIDLRSQAGAVRLTAMVVPEESARDQEE